VQVITGTGLYVKGSVSGDIDIEDRLDAGVLRIEGEETSTTTISIAEIVNGTIILGTDFFTFGNDFAGNLILGNGVPVGSSVVVNGNLTSPGTINLSGYPLAGLLRINNDASGSIINGGAASGFITLGFYPSRNFSGIATFSSLSGTIQTQSGANISGTLKILGDVTGAITMERFTAQGLDMGGDLESGGRISIGGAVSGDIEVGGSVAGDISVAGDVTGAVTVNRVLESTGRVMIDGLCDGAIAIGRETESLSLIRMTEGLGVNGSITVNDSGGDFDAGGTIHVGATKTVPPIVFDGSILIKKESGGPGGGDLNGKIIVRGCHATDDDLDICICGTNNGTVTLIQTGCPPLPTLVGWSCVSGCP